MNIVKFKISNYIPQWLLKVVIIFFIVLFIILISYLVFEKNYQDKIHPRVYLGDISLGGKTIAEAKTMLNKRIDKINQDGISFKYKNQQAVILPLISSVESDLTYQLINFDASKTINSIFSYTRNNNFINNLQNKINTLFFKQRAVMLITMNEQEIEKILSDRFSQYEIPAQDARLEINGNTVAITAEKLGKVINYKKGIKDLAINLKSLSSLSVQLTTRTDYPQILKNDCLNIENKVKQILTLAPLKIKYDKNQWLIKKSELNNWLKLRINQRLNDKIQDKIIVGLNPEVVKQFFEEDITPKINKEPIDAKFKIKDGRVVEFQASQDGLELSLEISFAQIEKEFIYNGQNEIELIARELKSQVHTEDVNNLGIKEIIGIGFSSFAGSPPNRRHNIKIGASSINGLLINPGEEFSLLKALGKIDKTTNYLPELVIKDNRTIPEYGGGLCQIGTTMFRAVLASGLPITMRRNHSYRVSYYEPAGTDATIYNPWPDFRFINDTKNSTLIQSRIEGDNLYFDFWGTKDGRIIEKTNPVIYNIVKPGPTKIIETIDLPVGEKKCTEHAHSGADAYFDYKITYPNKEVKEKRFNSHYVPWQEVCLIGVEELSDNNETASSTEDIVND